MFYWVNLPLRENRTELKGKAPSGGRENVSKDLEVGGSTCHTPTVQGGGPESDVRVG